MELYIFFIGKRKYANFFGFVVMDMFFVDELVFVGFEGDGGLVEVLSFELLPN